MEGPLAISAAMCFQPAFGAIFSVGTKLGPPPHAQPRNRGKSSHSCATDLERISERGGSVRMGQVVLGLVIVRTATAAD